MKEKLKWERMWEEGVVYILTTECYSAVKENEILPFVATRVDLETVMLSEVSQRKTNTT